MNQPFISIIVPVYGVERYLPECLDSILAWQFSDWEAVLVDDGSPDNSGAICDAYADRDARFRVIHQENGGVGTARNAALDVARGTWVWFVDADDVIDPHTPVDKELLSKHDFVMFDEVVRFTDGEPIPYAPIPQDNAVETGGESACFFIQKKTCFHQSVWYRSNGWKRFRFSTNLKYGEDLEFMRRCEMVCHHPIHIHCVNYYYRQRAGSVMNVGAGKNPRMVHDVLIVLQNLLNFIDEEGVKPAPWLERRIEDHFKVVIVHAARGRVFDTETQSELQRLVAEYHQRGFRIFRRIDYRIATYSLRLYALVFNLKEKL